VIASVANFHMLPSRQRIQEMPPPLAHDDTHEETPIPPATARWVARLLDRLILAGLLLALAVLPLQSFRSELSSGMCLSLLLLWGGRAALEKRAAIVWTPVHLALLAFLGIAILQLVPLPFQANPLNFRYSFDHLPVALDHWKIISLDTQATAKTAAVLASLIGLFFIAANSIGSERRLRQVVNWLILTGAALSLLGILDRFSPPGHPLLRGTNFLGLYYHSLNRSVGYIEMIFPLPLALLVTRSARRDRGVWLYALAAIPIGISILSAGASSAVFVLIVELMSLLLWAIKQRVEIGVLGFRALSKAWVIIGAVAITGTIISGAAWLGTQPDPRMMASDVATNFPGLAKVDKIQGADDDYSRARVWKASLPMIADHPVFGVGLGAYPTAYPRYDRGSGIYLVNAAHNDYLQLLCETGIVGGAVMIVCLSLLARLSISTLKTERHENRGVALGATVGCLGILVHSLVDFHLQNPGAALLCLVLIALLVSVERMQNSYLSYWQA
jgi:O-antigen ligase